MKRGRENDTATLATSFGVGIEAETQLLFSEEDSDKWMTYRPLENISDCSFFYYIKQRGTNDGPLKRK